MESDRPTEIKSTKSKMLKPTENNFKITENDSTKFGILMLENRAKDSCIILNIDKKKCLEVNTQRELVLAEYQKENYIDEFGNLEKCVFGKVPERRQGMGLQGSESVRDSTRVNIGVNIGVKNESGQRKGMVQIEVGDGAMMMCESVLLKDTNSGIGMGVLSAVNLEECTVGVVIVNP